MGITDSFSMFSSKLCVSYSIRSLSESDLWWLGSDFVLENILPRQALERIREYGCGEWGSMRSEEERVWFIKFVLILLKKLDEPTMENVAEKLEGLPLHVDTILRVGARKDVGRPGSSERAQLYLSQLLKQKYLAEQEVDTASGRRKFLVWGPRQKVEFPSIELVEYMRTCFPDMETLQFGTEYELFDCTMEEASEDRQEGHHQGNRV